MPATYEKIATTTLGSAQASITFSSISAAYTDLRLVFTFTVSSATRNAFLRFNGDSGSNYSRTFLYGNGTSAASGRGTSTTHIVLDDDQVNGGSTTIPQFIAVDIFSYAGSTNKTLLINANSDVNGSGAVYSKVGLWRNTSAITSIVLDGLGFTNFNSGTTATLYGILKA